MDRGRTVMTRLINNNNNEETIQIAAPLTGMRGGRLALTDGGMTSAVDHGRYGLWITAANGTMSPRRNLPVTTAHIMRRIRTSVVTTVHL